MAALGQRHVSPPHRGASPFHHQPFSWSRLIVAVIAFVMVASASIPAIEPVNAVEPQLSPVAVAELEPFGPQSKDVE